MFVNKSILILFVAFLSGIPVFAQNAEKPEFECSIYILNINSNDPDVLDREPARLLAHFTVDGTMEEQRIVKFFKLPHTQWFVVASLYTTDESMLSRSGIGSIDTELSFARRRRRNILASPAVAISETPFKTFDVTRVSTVVRLSKRRLIVTMECKAP